MQQCAINSRALGVSTNTKRAAHLLGRPKRGQLLLVNCTISVQVDELFSRCRATLLLISHGRCGPAIRTFYQRAKTVLSGRSRNGRGSSPRCNQFARPANLTRSSISYHAPCTLPTVRESTVQGEKQSRDKRRAPTEAKPKRCEAVVVSALELGFQPPPKETFRLM